MSSIHTIKIFHLFASVAQSEIGFLVEIRERGNSLNGMQTFSSDMRVAIENMRQLVRRTLRQEKPNTRAAVAQSCRIVKQMQADIRCSNIEVAV